MAKECASALLDKLENNAVTMFIDALGRELTCILNKSLGHKTKSHSKRREKMWSLFFEFRSVGLVELWKGLLASLVWTEQYKDPWLVQVLARLVIESAIKANYPLSSPSDSASLDLTADEYCALRYSAGYVMYSLKKKHAADKPLVEWIRGMADTGSELSGVTSFLQFTRLWVEKVNRGGLFVINDSLFEVFLSMETVLRKYLSTITLDHTLSKDKVLEVLLEDNEIHFHWSVMTFDLDEEMSSSVLGEMIKLWVTIRGFSYASAIVDDYRHSCSIQTKRKKSLRKELKNKAKEVKSVK